MKRIYIIGFGNLLMGDDGAGIHLIQRLTLHPFPKNIQLWDGGVASFQVLDGARSANQVILIDSMAGGGQPGDIYRLEAPDAQALAKLSAPALSLHEGTLLQSLQWVHCAGPFPPVIIYGIEPERITFGTTLTPAVDAAVSRLADILTAELHSDRPE